MLLTMIMNEEAVRTVVVPFRFFDRLQDLGFETDSTLSWQIDLTDPAVFGKLVRAFMYSNNWTKQE